MFGNNKPFGTTSAFGGSTFGSTTTPFGQPAGTTTFGAKPNTGNVFGSSTFGAPTPAGGGLFGSTAPATSTGLFGSTSTAFGQPAPNAGSSFPFGGGTSTSGGLFGSSAPATQTSGLFGGSTNSAFGSTRPAFGGFGTTTTGTGLFGQTNTAGAGLFGTSGGFATTPTNGTTIKFNPPTGTDTMMKGGVTQNINTRHQCITCMKEYENKSLEELRLEDYVANRKGPQAGSTIGAFGAPAAQTGLFGNPAASSSAFSFGTTQSKPLFGTTTGTNTFGNTGTGLFGQPAQPQNTGIFGKPVGFGTATTSTAPNFAFGNTTGSTLFGQNNQQKPLFGQPAAGTGLFGQPAATTQTSTAFGTGTGFGAFGATSQPSMGLFGKPSGAATTNTFSFGNTTANTGGLFGQKPAGSAFGTTTGFGNTNTFGSFGTTQTTNTGLFGQNKQAGTAFGTTGTGFGSTLGTGFGTSTFGTGLGMNAGTGTGLFGNTLTNNKPGFNFGGTGTTGFGFGQPVAAGTSFNFGTNTAPLGGSVNDPNVLQQQLLSHQVSALTSNPFGDNPLFRNALRDSKRREEVLKPTNPAAQKAVLTNSHYKVSPFPITKVKPKSLTPVSAGKVSLFDGLEDEEPSLGSTTFVPKRSVKKLVMRSQSNSSSFTVRSNITSSGGRKINFSTSILLEKTPPESDASKGDVVKDSPLTVDIQETASSSRSLPVNPPVIDVPSEGSFTSKILPAITLESPLLNLNDTIEALHTKPLKSSARPLTTCPDPENPKKSLNLSASFSDPEVSPILEDEKKHGTGITLRRQGYYTVPSLDELLPRMDINGVCMVRDFTVGREEYGKVCFFGEFDVANLNLDQIVSFRRKEITVYPDDDEKPPVGVELNREAEVTLECVWPLDKTTHEPIKDLSRLALLGYRERIEKTTLRLGAQFINYIPETGSWIFKVDHFSKYGLEDSEDESEETDPKLLLAKSKDTGAVKKVPPPSSTSFNPTIKKMRPTAVVVEDDDDEMQDADIIPPGDSIFSPLQHLVTAGLDSERIQGMKASFFLDDVDNNWADNDMDFQEPITQFGPMKAIGHFPKPVPVKRTVIDSMMQHSYKDAYSFTEDPKMTMALASSNTIFGNEQSKSASLIIAAREEIWSAYPSITPVNLSPPLSTKMHQVFLETSKKITLRPYKCSSLYNKRNCIVDMGYFMGRSFRIGWGPNSTLMHIGPISGNTETENSITNETTILSTMPLSKSSSGLTNNPFSLAMSQMKLIGEVKVDEVVKSNMVESLNVQLQHCRSQVEDGVPIFVPNPGIEILHAQASVSEQLLQNSLSHEDVAFMRQCNHVWELCVALWGEIPGLESDRVISTYAQQMARREALSNWIIKTTKEKAYEEITNNNFDINQNHLSTIFSYLSIREISKAVLIAQESNDHFLAVLLAQAEGNSIFRHLINKQLMEWEESEAYNYISSQRLKLYCLLAGLMVWTPANVVINCCENVDWRRNLALHLWYSCLPSSDIRDAVADFERSFSNSDDLFCYADPPFPPYRVKSEMQGNSRTCVYDTCYHLLKLYCDRSYRLDKLLMPRSYTSSNSDYRLSWLLHQALVAVGYCHLATRATRLLHLKFSSQLETIGLWHWAVFVVLHFPCAKVREKYVKDILLRHISLEDGIENKEKEEFLHEKLLIPLEWIYHAKAIKAQCFKTPAEEAWYLLKAGHWNSSHKIVISQLAADAIINEDYDYLLSFLDELALPERSEEILDWSSGGQVFLDYIHVSKMVSSVVKGEVSAYDIEKLQPEVISLCHRLSSIQCNSAKDRLCQSEMAKKTATLLRSIVTFHAESSGNPTSTYTLTPHIKSLPMPEDYALQELRALTRSYILSGSQQQ